MCKQHEELYDPVDNQATSSRIYHDKLKADFGKVLANVLFEEEGVRKLIKEEALKKFNYDYEVLYQMIKDRPVNGTKTLHQMLCEQEGNELLMDEVMRELPLLTIMVPELPQNSFSAESWDVETELPVVGLRVWSDQGVPMLVGNGEEFFLPFDQIPGFPVVVVKDNERVTISSSADELTFKAPNSDFFYKFTDANFDNLINPLPANDPLARTTKILDPKIINAKNIMDPVDGWHRDHIYYGLTPGNDKGPFSLAFKESITSFRFFEGKAAYDKISQQPGDPGSYGFFKPATTLPL